MQKDRVIVDIETVEEAKKVEETVKTGFAETAVENILQWSAVEGDLLSSYRRLAEKAGPRGQQEAYRELCAESGENLTELARLLGSLEELDRKRVKRIELLASLGP